MRNRAVLFLFAIGAAIVATLGAIRWKDIAIRFQILRLSGNTQLQDAWLGRSADSVAGRALRTYFRERPDELIRRILRTVPPLPMDSGDRPPPGLKDLEGLDRITATLAMDKPDGVGKIHPRMISFGYERKDRAVTAILDGFDQDDAGRIASLVPLYDLLKVAGNGTATLAEHPGWTFRIVFEEDGESLKEGIRGQYGEWTGAEDEIAIGETLWTGKELLVFGWPNGAALDPLTGKWRAIRGNERIKGPWTCPISLSDGTILTASKPAPRTIAFCLYRIDRDAWEKIGETSPGHFDHPGEERHDINILGGTAMRDGAVVFVKARGEGSPIRGIRVDPTGRICPIEVRHAPEGLPLATAIHSFGSKMLFWGYDGTGLNTGGIWDGDADRWEELPPGGAGNAPRHFFSHFKTDDEVIILGGIKHGSTDLDDAIAFSMARRSWRQVPVPPGISLKTRPCAGWTGQEAWVWEGEALSTSDPEKNEAASAGLLDLRTGAWKPFPPGGPSPRHSPRSAWTGKEILFLGGQHGRWFLRDTWSFNPSTSTWRRLDNFPRSRQECAAKR
jgi:hypothetical protein